MADLKAGMDIAGTIAVTGLRRARRMSLYGKPRSELMEQ
jgi:hypothetical protein